MEVHYLAVYDGHAGTGAALMAAKALVNHLQVHGGHTLHSLSLTVPNLSLFFTPSFSLSLFLLSPNTFSFFFIYSCPSIPLSIVCFLAPGQTPAGTRLAATH